jgi:hypothetical protein
MAWFGTACDGTGAAMALPLINGHSKALVCYQHTQGLLILRHSCSLLLLQFARADQLRPARCAQGAEASAYRAAPLHAAV